MRRIVSLLVAVAAVASVFVFRTTVSGRAAQASAPVFLTTMPDGYRDWRWVSSAHEAGKLNSLGAVLGNDVAIRAYREGTLPYPDGTVIAALHYTHSASAENDQIFGNPQSFVPGAPTNIQFMVKDSVKYAATGGWGFGFFINGKPVPEAQMKSCFPCHAREKARDLVFTKYAP